MKINLLESMIIGTIASLIAFAFLDPYYTDKINDLQKKVNNKDALIEEQKHLISSYAEYYSKEQQKCERGVFEYENGYMIDGAYYEYKGIVE